jgi:hypothetical protein
MAICQVICTCWFSCTRPVVGVDCQTRKRDTGYSSTYRWGRQIRHQLLRECRRCKGADRNIRGCNSRFCIPLKSRCAYFIQTPSGTGLTWSMRPTDATRKIIALRIAPCRTSLPRHPTKACLGSRMDLDLDHTFQNGFYASTSDRSLFDLDRSNMLDTFNGPAIMTFEQ